ncbi:uncharacterized protein LOC129808777 [Phlebotomus papatasi]|uniref:uncharacterized protein LOC129808777 n=1 Tax=Phlebotomus papatasi TaxID=29031 RepID=UPI002483B2E1|nr:uncharacterized protein LOC129808777 [Phlebotomus papatasi]XP_055714605.1 uncharacterized protein LOC129808777 [Phlebotomus papatasi]
MSSKRKSPPTKLEGGGAENEAPGERNGERSEDDEDDDELVNNLREDDDEADDEDDDLDEELLEIDEAPRPPPSSASSDDLEGPCKKQRLAEIIPSPPSDLISSHTMPLPTTPDHMSNNNNSIKMSPPAGCSRVSNCTATVAIGRQELGAQKRSMDDVLRRLTNKMRGSSLREGITEPQTNNNNSTSSNLNICSNGGATKRFGAPEHLTTSTYALLDSPDYRTADSLLGCYPGSVQEKERKLNEMILQLQLVRDHLINQQQQQQHHADRVSLTFFFSTQNRSE